MPDSPPPSSLFTSLFRAVPDEVDGLPSVSVHAASGAVLRVLLLSDHAAEFRLAPDGTDFGPDHSYALDPDATYAGPSDWSVNESDEAITISTTALSLRFARATGHLLATDARGRVLTEIVEWSGQGAASFAARLRDGERLFGLGDKALPLDRRGHRAELWCTDAFGFQRGSDPLYKTVPFTVGVVEDGPACGLFFDNPAAGTVDVGATEPGVLRYAAERGHLRLTLFAGDEPLDVVRRYARRTGRMPMLPKWALGYHQCRYSYRSDADIREVARTLRERRIPCDVLYFDIHYMDGYRCFTWDREAFPDPGKLLADLREDGFQNVVIIDPGLKTDDPDYRPAVEAEERDLVVRHPDGSPFVGPVWPGRCVFPDFTDPEARRWWGEQHRELLDQGVGGVWNDMNEPAVFVEEMVEGAAESMDVEAEARTMPLDVRHDMDGHPADHVAAHNVYGMQMQRATFEGLRRLRPERRPFTITRAAYAGAQRFGTTWTGDNDATWDHLRLAMEQALSLGASGMPFSGADVGGFSGTPTGELLARWTQLGVVTPLFRNHSAVDTPRQEPYRFDEATEAACRAAIEWRYRLLPVLYTAMHEAATDGLPILRALPLVHPDQPLARRFAADGAYLGADLLAYPVFEPGQRRREVFLPRHEGGWFDLYTGRHFAGDETPFVDAPMRSGPPLFARAGSSVPLAPVRQHTGEPIETLTLRVFPRPGSFSSRLYDDAGDGYGDAYDAQLVGEDAGDRLTLRAEVDGAYQPEWSRWRVEVFGCAAPPRSVTVGGEAAEVEHDASRGMASFETSPGAEVVVVR
jgi:alpha-glucosidase